MASSNLWNRYRDMWFIDWATTVWRSLRGTSDRDRETVTTPGFETGVVHRRKLPTPEDIPFEVHDKPHTITGAHSERRIGPQYGYSSLGHGGILVYPATERVVVLVMEDGCRVEIDREWFEEMSSGRRRLQ